MNIVVPEKKTKDCKKCGQKVAERTSKLGKKFLTDVYQENGKLVLIPKNERLTEHQC